MSCIGTNYSQTSPIYQSVQGTSQPSQPAAPGFAQNLREAQNAVSTASGFGNTHQTMATNTYNRLGQVRAAQIFGVTAGSAQTAGAGQGLLSALSRAREDGYEATPETGAKLSGNSPSAFMEALGEISGQTPAQVMTALLNMSGAEATALSRELGNLTGADASTFIPMISRLTGHQEAMLRQCLNEEEDESQDQTGLSTARQLEQQRSLRSVEAPSIDVTV